MRGASLIGFPDDRLRLQGTVLQELEGGLGSKRPRDGHLCVEVIHRVSAPELQVSAPRSITNAVKADAVSLDEGQHRLWSTDADDQGRSVWGLQEEHGGFARLNDPIDDRAKLLRIGDGRGSLSPVRFER